jgi:hypothetical protein
MKRLITLALSATFLGANAAAVAEEAKPASSGGDLRAAVQNPISSLISLPFKFTFDNGADNGNASFLNVQPVIPVTVGDWNLVNRIIAPIIRAPTGVSGIPAIPNPTPVDNSNGGNSQKKTGLGDINYSLYFSPVKVGKIIWGVGPSITAPTATHDQLGSGKWSAGPTGVLLTQTSWGSVGLLGRQLWSFAGDSDRNSVSQALIEPFINYNLKDGWFLISDMVATANWKASSGNKWTIPVGGGAGPVFKIGGQAINSRLEAYYNVVTPDGAPTWTLSWTWQFLFPK